jgi:hypothetical protein
MRTENKSLNNSMDEGSTDGKYRKVRPNTTVAPGTGEDLMLANRRALNPYWNYDFIDQEMPNKLSPASMSVTPKTRPAMDVADVANNKMMGTY